MTPSDDERGRLHTTVLAPGVGPLAWCCNQVEGVALAEVTTKIPLAAGFSCAARNRTAVSTIRQLVGPVGLFRKVLQVFLVQDVRLEDPILDMVLQLYYESKL